MSDADDDDGHDACQFQEFVIVSRALETFTV